MGSLPTCDLTLAGYSVYKWIGHCYNGYGDVFTARNNDTTRVVIKRILLDETIDTSDYLKEVLMLRNVNHPNIINFYSCFVCEDNICIALPTCAYGSALDIMLSSYPTGLPEKAIAAMIMQVLPALAYLHTMRIVHRSIRASHILIEENGRVRLTGFRCARQLRRDEEHLTEYERTMEGSMLWLAPEVLSQDLRGYDSSSDIYSLGITFCELANGFPPFSDMEPLQMLFRKCNGTTPKLLDMSTMPQRDGSPHSMRQFSEGFHTVTNACLKFDQTRRPDARWLQKHPFFHRRKGVLTRLPDAKLVDAVERISERPPRPSPPHPVPAWD